MKIHTVQKGDTIFSIARKYSTSPLKIIENNDLKIKYSLNNNLSLCFEYFCDDRNYLIAVNLNEDSNKIELETNYREINKVFSTDDSVSYINNSNLNILNISINPWEAVIYECKWTHIKQYYLVKFG